MRAILKILGVQQYTNKKTGEPFYRTYALVDGGDEVVGFGNDFQAGELVEVFHHDKWDTSKMQKPQPKSEEVH